MSKIGDVHAFELADGRWGALWITRVEKKSLAAEVLDWVGDAIPSLDDLGTPRPMLMERLRGEGRPSHSEVHRASVPAYFPKVGRLPREPAEEPSSMVVWGSFPHEVLLELRWAATSRGAREHFLTCAANREATVEVEAAGEVPIMRRRVDLDLSGQTDPYDWSQLDRLGALLVLGVTGPAPGLGEYLASRSLIRHLVWKDPGPGDLDLSDAGLEELDLSGAGSRTLQVGAELDQLRLEPEDAESLRVVHPAQGHGLTLRVEHCTGSHPGTLPGLERLSGLVLARPPRLEAARLAGYQELRSLWARLDAGELDDPGELGALRDLRTLHLDDVYATEAADLPDLDAWPELDEVVLDGLRKEDATTLKKRWKGVAHLEVRNAKDPAWVRAHLRSPFRNWDEEVGRRAGATACKAYEKAARAAAKEGSKAEPVLRTFMDALEKIHTKTALDTDQRERAGEVFHQLATDLGVDEVQAQSWFDDWRSF
jgi:hypothetical protein